MVTTLSPDHTLCIKFGMGMPPGLPSSAFCIPDTLNCTEASGGDTDTGCMDYPTALYVLENADGYQHVSLDFRAGGWDSYGTGPIVLGAFVADDGRRFVLSATTAAP